MKKIIFVLILITAFTQIYGSQFGSILQRIESSTVNSYSDTLQADSTFTGTSEETFGINGIQVYHFADQPCTIYIDQSLDGTNWDIIDSFDCLANDACTRTYTSVAPYFRTRVTNTGEATATVRFATGLTPIINPLPRTLSSDGRLASENTIVGQQNTERHVWVSPSNALNTVTTTRLVGTNFDGTIIDPNFWDDVVANDGTITQSGGEIEMQTNTTANATTQLNSIRRARFVVGSALQWQAITKFVTTGTADNVRRAGAYDDGNGFFYEFDVDTLRVVFRKDSVDTQINSGSFNGNYGISYDMDTSYHKLAIEWTPRGVFFYIDGKLLHKDNAGHRSDFLSLPIRFENNNDNDSTSDVVLDILASAIVRYGQLETSSTYKYISGASTTVCKYGGGVLHMVVNSDNAGTVTLYDDTSAVVGNEIGFINTLKVIGSIDYKVPFNRGLTVVTTGAVNITVVYE